MKINLTFNGNGFECHIQLKFYTFCLFSIFEGVLWLISVEKLILDNWNVLLVLFNVMLTAFSMRNRKKQSSFVIPAVNHSVAFKQNHVRQFCDKIVEFHIDALVIDSTFRHFGKIVIYCSTQEKSYYKICNYFAIEF